MHSTTVEKTKMHGTTVKKTKMHGTTVKKNQDARYDGEKKARCTVRR